MTQAGSPGTTSARLSLPRWGRVPRYQVEAVVAAQRPIIGHEFEIVFHAPSIARAARPGQFVEILFGDNYAPLVRRPFSLYRVDAAAGTCSVLYLARGSFTSGLSHKREGDIVSLLGPLGRPFHWTVDFDLQHILVAGGLGAPPLFFLASELARAHAASADSGGGMPRNGGAFDQASIPTIHSDRAGENAGLARGALAKAANARLVVINAARTESLLVGLSEFGELDVALHVMTDDGSRGTKGMATDLLLTLLEAEKDTDVAKAVYACGPMPMLRSVGEIAIKRGLPCQLSIETSMPCGIGLCNGCATKVYDPSASEGFSYALACVEGPVFEARDLVWS